MNETERVLTEDIDAILSKLQHNIVFECPRTAYSGSINDFFYRTDNAMTYINNLIDDLNKCVKIFVLVYTRIFLKITYYVLILSIILCTSLLLYVIQIKICLTTDK